MTRAQQQYVNMGQREYAEMLHKTPKDEREEHRLIHQIQLLSGTLQREFKQSILKELEQHKADYLAKYGTYEIEHYAPPRQQLSLF